MTRNEVAALVATRQDAMNRHDLAGLNALFDEHCRVDSPTAGGVVRGRRAAGEIDRTWADGFPDVSFSTGDLLIEGESLAWILTASGTDTGGFMGLPPTGKPFELPMVILSTVRDGRIASERRIYDFTNMLVQVGILKAKTNASLVGRSVDTRSPPAVPTPHPSDETVPQGALTRLLADRRQAWERRDLDALANQHAGNCVMESHLAGRVEGRTAIRDVYARWFNAFPDSSLTTELEIADGDRVALVGIQSGTDTGGFLGLAPTGRPFHLPIVWLFGVERGLFTFVRPFYDFTGMLVQLGVLKAKPA
jgi:predicted ester cyclase